MSTNAPNGNRPPFDPTNPDPVAMAGVLLNVVAWQDRHGPLIVKVAQALGVDPDRSEPPPPIRDSISKLETFDAMTSQQIEALTKEQAAAKLEIQKTRSFGEAMGDVAKAGGKVAAALTLVSAAAGGLLMFAKEVWAALHGH